MSNFTDSYYDINEVSVVTLNEDYIENIKQDEGYIKSFNPNLAFFVKRFYIQKEKNTPYYYEIYTECISGQDVYVREDTKKFRTLPKLFKTLKPFPIEYLDEEELKTGKVSFMRLFEIFQEMNIKNKTKILKK